MCPCPRGSRQSRAPRPPGHHAHDGDSGLGPSQPRWPPSAATAGRLWRELGRCAERCRRRPRPLLLAEPRFRASGSYAHSSLGRPSLARVLLVFQSQARGSTRPGNSTRPTLTEVSLPEQVCSMRACLQPPGGVCPVGPSLGNIRTVQTTSSHGGFPAPVTQRALPTPTPSLCTSCPSPAPRRSVSAKT